MLLRRRPQVVALVITLTCTVGINAQKDKKQDEAEKKEAQAMRKLVDDMGANPSVPNDLALYVDASGFLEGPKQQGIRAVHGVHRSVEGHRGVDLLLLARRRERRRRGTRGSGLRRRTTRKDKDKDKKTEFAWEDVSFITVTAGQAPLRIARSFMVSAGDYDVFVVAKEPTPEKAPKNAPPPKMSVLKQTVTVPDFWNSELNTSSLIVAQRIDPLPAPLTPDQLRERPYGALGAMEIASGLR